MSKEGGMALYLPIYKEEDNKDFSNYTGTKCANYGSKQKNNNLIKNNTIRSQSWFCKKAHQSIYLNFEKLLLEPYNIYKYMR